MRRRDFGMWPADANELIVRLYGWWSRNQWLVVQESACSTDRVH